MYDAWDMVDNEIGAYGGLTRTCDLTLKSVMQTSQSVIVGHQDYASYPHSIMKIFHYKKNIITQL